MPLPKFRGADQMSAEPSQPAPAEPKPPTGPAKTNAYGAKCRQCGQWVAAREGSLTGSNGVWEVRHYPHCPNRPEDAPQAAPEPAGVQQNYGPDGNPIFDGTYTVSIGDTHRTFRLRTQSADADFMPGVQIIQTLVGADNDRDYSSVGHIKNSAWSVWKKHRDNEVLVRFIDAFRFGGKDVEVDVSVACYACGRTLTVPASIHNGLGPDCAKKAGL